MRQACLISISTLLLLAGRAEALYPDTATDPSNLWNFVGVTDFNFKNPGTDVWSGASDVSCVAIGPNLVLTAKHTSLGKYVSFDPDPVGQTDPSGLVQVNTGSRREIAGTDLVVYQTITPIAHYAPIALSDPVTSFTATDTVEQDGSIDYTLNPTGSVGGQLEWVGYGITGHANQADTGYIQDQTPNGGRGERRATLGSADISGVLTGNPGPGNVAQNYSAIGTILTAGGPLLAGGDSGGGLFEQVGGQWELVGINSYYVDDPQNSLKFTTVVPGSTNQQFYTASFAADVTGYRSQIYATPEPGPIVVLGLGAAAALRRRVRRAR